MGNEIEKTFVVRIDRNVIHVDQITRTPDNRSYADWILFAVVMSGLDALWLLLFWSLPILAFMGVVWLLITAAITTAGIREARDNRHHH